ncbi:hypothetical protein [Streptomyces sp. NPDC059708]|uniref:hypothetical protein n=1 Tax=Streptomyces sp. NPDC059708 TaxID=3346916 RepID=UPI003694CD02
MSTPSSPGSPEEQQRRQQQAAAAQQDPYSTQTWQADTWETGYQPVQPPLGSVPGQAAPQGQSEWQPQAGGTGTGGGAPWPDASAGGGAGWQGQPQAPAVPDAWFRDAQPQAQAPGGGVPWPDASSGAGTAYPQAQPQPQPAVPDSWFRDPEPQAPAPSASAAETAYLPPVRQPEPPQQTGGGLPWPDASPAAETAYLPPVRESADAPAYPSPYPGQAQPAVPDSWFRDPQPQTPAPSASAAETAYLPPVRDPQPDVAAAETAYLPPVPPMDMAAAETAYLPPVRDPQPDVAAAETAYLPPVPPMDVAAAETAYLPPVRDPQPDVAAAETAYLPPVRDPQPESAAAQTAYLPPVRDPQPPAGAGAAGGAGAEWSPPTLGGNTLRAVDPAQARAEGRSPIIDPGPQSAILTAALGLALAAAAALGTYALLAPLIALQGLTAAGWFRLNGMWPARQGIALAFAGALVADGAVLAVDGTYGPGAIIGTLGVWVLLTLVLQLRSHADPDERMYGLMASVTSAALAIACTGFLAADWHAVTAGAAAVAVAVFARALPLPTAPSVGVSLAAAAGAGIAVGGLVGLGAGGALVGLVAGVCALVGLRVAAYDYPSKFVHMTAGVALPLAVAAPAVYLIGRVVG